MEQLRLTCGHSEVSVFPHVGAAIGHWRWGARELLRHTPANASVGDMACFPLVPYANRIAYARLAEGATLTPHPGERHSLHGTGWQRAWELVHADPTIVRLHLRHHADQDWPYDFVASLDILLAEDTLSQQLTIRNLDNRCMPAGLGFHPYFPVDAATRLRTQWRGVWETSPDCLPTEHRPIAQCETILPTQWTVDNCFTGWDRRAVLCYEDYTLTLQSGQACGFVQCYQPGPDSGFIAIEPVTHLPNAHHLESKLPGETGLRFLEKNESLTIVMTLAAAARPAD